MFWLCLSENDLNKLVRLLNPNSDCNDLRPIGVDDPVTLMYQEVSRSSLL